MSRRKKKKVISLEGVSEVVALLIEKKNINLVNILRFKFFFVTISVEFERT